MDPLRVYVVFDPGFRHGVEWARFLTQALSSVGMQREEVRVGVPVQWRWKPWGGADSVDEPLPIDLERASQNVVVVLADINLLEVSSWSAWMTRLRESMRQRGGLDCIVPVKLAGALPDWIGKLNALSLGNGADAGDELQRTQFLVRLLNLILAQRDPSGDPFRSGHGIFLSHAKRDGKAAAERFVDRLNSVKANLGVRYFYDAVSLLASEDYEARFVESIKSGSLLAIVTDAYHTRPWCRWEVLTAKEHRRPVVVADMCSDRIERTYPYLSNVPSIRLPAADPDDLSESDIERLLLALLAEALRVELWREQAQRLLVGRVACVAVRPPELADLAVLPPALREGEHALLLYPDPPLGGEETDLLRRALPGLLLLTPSQLESVEPAGGRLRPLDGRLIAISVSNTPVEDLERLGLAVSQRVVDADHQDITDAVLRAVLTPLVVAGSRIAYGGRIEAPHNFTQVIYDQLGVAYRRTEGRRHNRPFINFQHAARVLRARDGTLATHLRSLAPYGEVWVTNDGRIVGRLAADEGEAGSLLAFRTVSNAGSVDPRPEVADDEAALRATGLWKEIASRQPRHDPAALTDMRMQMAGLCHARVLVGGRVSGFNGTVPGLIEEAVLTIAAGRTLLVLGGFGGISRDIAAALGLVDDALLVPRQAMEYWEGGQAYKPKVEAGLAQLRAQRSAFKALFSDEEFVDLRELASTNSLEGLGIGVSKLLSKRLAT
jgi:SLOG cluster2/TIR domain